VIVVVAVSEAIGIEAKADGTNQAATVEKT
jgi:hypothetical protein